MNTESKKVSLIGLGKMGHNHLRNLSILKKVDLEYIYDQDFKKAKQLALEYNTTAVEDIDHALSNIKIDATVICTPTSTHVDYIEKAAPNIKNIFVEKPMAKDINRAKHVRNIVSENETNLQVGFIERFNPVVQRLKDVIDSSSKVINLDFIRTNKVSSRITDVDVIVDLMIHDIDLALHLNGPIKDVSGFGTLDGDLIGFATAVLAHENGRLSHIQASRMTEKKVRRIQATCEDRFIDCSLLKKEILVNKQSETVHKEGMPYRIQSIEENIEVSSQEPLLAELAAFIATCDGEYSSNVANVDDAITALDISARIQSDIFSRLGKQ